jgi:uncharacterized repeat protein (TIGR02543 family)
MLRLARRFLFVLIVVLLVVSPFHLFSAQAPTAVTTQLALAVDGSSSISSSEFAIFAEGLATAVRNASQMPHDGTVELTVVQYGGWFGPNRARVEVYPTVITVANYESVASTIGGMSQMGGYTPLADGILMCWSQMNASSNFPIATKQAINVATNGEPNVALVAAPPPSWITLLGPPPGDGDGDATWVRNGAVSEGLDELDAEGIDATASGLNWMRDYLVYPQPGTFAPPFTPGWVLVCADFEEFAASIGEKFRVVTHQYTLTTSVVGSGSVSKNPDQATYTYGTSVQLTATPAAGWSFSHWTGDLTGSTNPDSVTMDDNKTVTAHFTQDVTYTLTITATSGGTTSPSPGAHVYSSGTNVAVAAIPQSGYQFDHWELDTVNVGSANPYAVTMNADHTLHAVFKEAPSPPPAVGGYALPINLDLGTSISLIPRICLASALFAIVAATIILVRRRKKTLERER